MRGFSVDLYEDFDKENDTLNGNHQYVTAGSWFYICCVAGRIEVRLTMKST